MAYPWERRSERTADPRGLDEFAAAEFLEQTCAAQILMIHRLLLTYANA
jgi:hypothetical protein